MRGGAGVVLGAISLAVLDGIVSRKQAASNVGGFIADAGNAVNWFLSPTVPAFKTSTATTTPTSSAPTTTPGSTTTTTAPALTPEAPANNLSGSTVPALSAAGTSLD
jgi:hypothetical protein